MLKATCGILFTALLFMKDEASPVLEEAIAMQAQFLHLRNGDSNKGVEEGNIFIILLMSCKPSNIIILPLLL